MLSETEAKTKWCPFARTLAEFTVVVREGDDPIPVAASINRDVGVYDKDGNETVVINGRHRCIASECMAWRSLENADTRTLQANRLTPLDRGHGHCGLMGSP